MLITLQAVTNRNLGGREGQDQDEGEGRLSQLAQSPNRCAEHSKAVNMRLQAVTKYKLGAELGQNEDEGDDGLSQLAAPALARINVRDAFVPSPCESDVRQPCCRMTCKLVKAACTLRPAACLLHAGCEGFKHAGIDALQAACLMHE